MADEYEDEVFDNDASVDLSRYEEHEWENEQTHSSELATAPVTNGEIQAFAIDTTVDYTDSYSIQYKDDDIEMEEAASMYEDDTVGESEAATRTTTNTITLVNDAKLYQTSVKDDEELYEATDFEPGDDNEFGPVKSDWTTIGSVSATATSVANQSLSLLIDHTSVVIETGLPVELAEQTGNVYDTTDFESEHVNDVEVQYVDGDFPTPCNTAYELVSPAFARAQSTCVPKIELEEDPAIQKQLERRASGGLVRIRSSLCRLPSVDELLQPIPIGTDKRNNEVEREEHGVSGVADVDTHTIAPDVEYDQNEENDSHVAIRVEQIKTYSTGFDDDKEIATNHVNIRAEQIESSGANFDDDVMTHVNEKVEQNEVYQADFDVDEGIVVGGISPSVLLVDNSTMGTTELDNVSFVDVLFLSQETLGDECTADQVHFDTKGEEYTGEVPHYEEADGAEFDDAEPDELETETADQLQFEQVKQMKSMSEILSAQTTSPKKLSEVDVKVEETSKDKLGLDSAKEESGATNTDIVVPFKPITNPIELKKVVRAKPVNDRPTKVVVPKKPSESKQVAKPAIVKEKLAIEARSPNPSSSRKQPPTNHKVTLPLDSPSRHSVSQKSLHVPKSTSTQGCNLSPTCPSTRPNTTRVTVRPSITHPPSPTTRPLTSSVLSTKKRSEKHIEKVKTSVEPIRCPPSLRVELPQLDREKREWLLLNMFRHGEETTKYEAFIPNLSPTHSRPTPPSKPTRSESESDTIPVSTSEKTVTMGGDPRAPVKSNLHSVYTRQSGRKLKQPPPDWVCTNAQGAQLPPYDSILDKYCKTVTSPLVQRQIYETRLNDLSPQVALVLEKRAFHAFHHGTGLVGSSYRSQVKVPKSPSNARQKHQSHSP